MAIDPSLGDDPQGVKVDRMNLAMDRHLSPAETAKRFGLTVKALRLYERHGLLKPLRTTNGSTGAAWRVYGPEQIARLAQILALKRLGLTLAQIGELLASEDSMEPILALQERILVEDRERMTRALTLVRKAQAKLASGEALSIDDLATLTQETVMTKQPTAEELKDIKDRLRQKHLTPGENTRMRQWASDQADLVSAMKELLEEAKALMASGEDPTSTAALDLAKRLRAGGERLKGSDLSLVTALSPKWKALWNDVQSDPEISQKMSPAPEVVGFISKAMAKLKAQEESRAGDGAI